MAANLVNAATSEKLVEVDWTKNIEICELIARDHSQAKDVIKAIKKRLGSKNSNSLLYAVMLLEMLMNNIGEQIYKLVIDVGILPILVKTVKKKSDLQVRERIFLLLDATQTSLGGGSGKFPQYYAAYYDLVSAGVQFPQRPPAVLSDNPTQAYNSSSPTGEGRSSGEAMNRKVENPVVPESSVIQKAFNALEVLKEVLDAVDTHNPEEAKDEFTLDLVEQCSFQQQRVIHVAMTSRDEKVVSQAIDLNEKLQNVLARHDSLLQGRSVATENHWNHEEAVMPTSTANHYNHEEAEAEEEEEQLFRRLRKGKACARSEDEDSSAVRPPLSLVGLSISGGRTNRPIMRRLSKPEEVSCEESDPSVVIPPPPAKHVERLKFFQEKKTDASAITGANHSRSASSLLSHSPSSSCNGSIGYD